MLSMAYGETVAGDYLNWSELDVKVSSPALLTLTGPFKVFGTMKSFPSLKSVEDRNRVAFRLLQLKRFTTAKKLSVLRKKKNIQKLIIFCFIRSNSFCCECWKRSFVFHASKLKYLGTHKLMFHAIADMLSWQFYLTIMPINRISKARGARGWYRQTYTTWCDIKGPSLIKNVDETGK